MSKRLDDWIDDDEYPDEKDVDDFGDDSPVDYDRRTIGKVRNFREPFWTRTRVLVVILLAILLASFILAEVVPLFRR